MRNKLNKKQVFPRIFCLEDIQCTADDIKGVNYRAILYHDLACITVSFDSTARIPELKNGAFVSIRWLPRAKSEHGAIRVAGLNVLNCSAKNFNPFLIVPHTWSIDRHLVDCARGLWDISSKEMRQLLFTTVFTQAGYLKRQ